MVLADAALLGGILHPVETFTKMITGAIAGFIDGARGDIDKELAQRLYSTVDTSVTPARPFTANPSLRRLNLSLALAADILLAVVVLFASLRVMFDHSLHSRYSLKVLLPKVLLAVLLVHFSLPLMQMGVDLDNALSATVVSLGDQTGVAGMPWSPSLAPATVKHLSVTGDIFHAVFALCVCVALLILVLAYVLRHALLSVLIVAAPMAALCSPLPETRGHARTWLRLFTVTLLMQPVQLLVLRVAQVIAVDGNAGLTQALEALATLFLMLKVPGALNEASHLETKAETQAKHVAKALRKAALAHVAPHHAAARTHTRRTAS